MEDAALEFVKLIPVDPPVTPRKQFERYKLHWLEPEQTKKLSLLVTSLIPEIEAEPLSV